MIPSLESVCIRENGSLFEALEVLQKGGAGIALVQSAEGRLLGILTDGDIRRALLEHASLSDPVAPFVSQEMTTVSPQAPRAEVLDLMQALKIHQVPVVDEAGYVKGLHLLHEILGAVDRPHWAVIMAGGRGMRLGDLTSNTPKPMLKVAGRPILERLILHLVGFGISRIFLSVHYLAEVIQEHFGDGSRFGCRIEYLHEDQPLGTGGALSLLPEIPEHPVLVCNGDLVTQADIDAMIRFHETEAYDLTVGVRDYSYQIPLLRGDRRQPTRLDQRKTLDGPSDQRRDVPRLSGCPEDGAAVVFSDHGPYPILSRRRQTRRRLADRGRLDRRGPAP
jgi:GTP:adenosylcobinamide-phosphate guanylyltransferase